MARANLRDRLSANQPVKPSHGTYRSYISGFLFSLALTLAAYALVNRHVQTDHQDLSHAFIISSVVVLALVQFTVQLVYFLHLGRESKPRWNLMAFLFMLLVVIIVVFGSLWIMNNLDYHMRSPTETDSYIHQLEGL